MTIEKKNMIGMDASHHNSDFMKKQMGCWDFEIHKLSEGSTYVDPTVKDWWQSRLANSLNGVYHYLNNANAQKQATHVTELLAKYGMEGKVMLVIDYEDGSLSPTKHDGVDKLKSFIKSLKCYYPNYQPVIYCNKTARNAIMRYCRSNTWQYWSLWLADYSTNTESHEEAWTPMMRQWTSRPFDMDIFFGSPDSWKAFYKLW